DRGRPAGAARRPAQGRRPVPVRPRRRGGRGAAGGGVGVRGGPRRDGGAGGGGLRRHPADAPAAQQRGGPGDRARAAGEAGLRSELAWFERRPLFGKRVLVTRPRGQAGDMVRRLEQLGAAVSVLPAVEIREPADWSPVDRALADLARFRWVVFTSANGVHHFL